MQTGIPAYRHGPGADQFEAVLVRRVVAAGDHDPGVKRLVGGGVVDFFRTAEAQIRDPRPGCQQPLGQGVAQLRSGQTGVAPQHHGTRAQHVRHGPAQGTGQIGIESIRHAAPDVIGFEAGKIVGHGVLASSGDFSRMLVEEGGDVKGGAWAKFGLHHTRRACYGNV